MLYCGSGTGVVSLFFKINDKANPFFAWLPANNTASVTAPVDLTVIAAKDLALQSMISGYIGSDTVPPTCTGLVCWYIVETV